MKRRCCCYSCADKQAHTSTYRRANKHRNKGTHTYRQNDEDELQDDDDDDDVVVVLVYQPSCANTHAQTDKN